MLLVVVGQGTLNTMADLAAGFPHPLSMVSKQLAGHPHSDIFLRQGSDGFAWRASTSHLVGCRLAP